MMTAETVPGGRAAFLDKDGTLIEDLPYGVDPGAMRFLPGVEQGLRLLARDGRRLVVVTNQAGVARGHFPESALRPVAWRLARLFADAGVRLDGFFYCPHDADGVVLRYAMRCGCRKPQAGLIAHACRALGLDARACWMVGDILDDVEAGRRAGCRTALVDCGNETEWVLSAWRLPDIVAADLGTAARLITHVAQCVAPAELAQ
jgi:histidinol-phosphate phosphatase family protein